MLMTSGLLEVNSTTKLAKTCMLIDVLRLYLISKALGTSPIWLFCEYNYGISLEVMRQFLGRMDKELVLFSPNEGSLSQPQEAFCLHSILAFEHFVLLRLGPHSLHDRLQPNICTKFCLS